MTHDSQDGHEARTRLANWFHKMLEELDEDHVTDPAAIDDLHGQVGRAFAEWRVRWGYGLAGLGTGPETR